MTDKEIIKALECCMRVRSLSDCLQSACPARTREGCSYYLRAHEKFKGVIFVELIKDALDLITRQKAEIEQLKFEIAKLLPKGCPYAIQVEVSNKLEAQIKSEAVKEFADELCKGRVSNDPVVIAVQAELNMTKGKAKPEKCPYFCEKQRIKGWINSATPITEPITVCSGTREQDECTCGGDKYKCDFYPKDYSYGY